MVTEPLTDALFPVDMSPFANMLALLLLESSTVPVWELPIVIGPFETMEPLGK